jgi:hypothetical protein
MNKEATPLEFKTCPEILILFILGLTPYIFGSLNSGTNSWSIFSITSGADFSKEVR